jgi:type IV secretion system protein VirB1
MWCKCDANLQKKEMAVILTAAALATIAATCAPGIDVKDLKAVARVESSFNTTAIRDNTSGKSYFPAETSHAVTLARQLMGAGHSIDAGVTQINSANFAWLGLTPETAFDPCESLRAAKAHLQAFSRYNTGDPVKGLRNGYVGRVMAARYSDSPSAAKPPSPPADRVPPRKEWANPFLIPAPSPAEMTFTIKEIQ